MTTGVRSTVTRATVALAVCFAFVLATLFVGRSQFGSEPPGHRGIFVAARVVTQLTTAPRELTEAKGKAPSLAEAIEGRADRLGPAHDLGPMLPGACFDHFVAAAELASLLDDRAITSPWRQRSASDQHRSRAPPLSI